RWRDHATGAELPRARHSFHRAAPWRLRRRHGAGEAQLSLSRHRHHRNRAHDAGSFPALSLARGPESRRLTRSATLLQAVGAAHLVWRRGDGDRRRALALGPAFACGRTEAGAEQGRALAGGVDPYEVVLSYCRSAHAGGLASGACGPARRNPFRSGAGGSRALSLEGAALHGLPEPVDRRFRRAARARLAHPRARTIAGGRERPAGDQFSDRPLRRVRAAEAAIFMAHRAAVACSGGGAAHRRVRRLAARTARPSRFGSRNRSAGKAHAGRSGTAIGDFAPGRAMRRHRLKSKHLRFNNFFEAFRPYQTLISPTARGKEALPILL